LGPLPTPLRTRSSHARRSEDTILKTRERGRRVLIVAQEWGMHIQQRRRAREKRGEGKGKRGAVEGQRGALTFP